MKEKNVNEHSLTDAVTDGALTEESAFCGLRSEDIERLSARYADALVLVRLRTVQAYGRTVISIADLARWTRDGDTLVADGQRWKHQDIRDVFPLALEAPSPKAELIPRAEVAPLSPADELERMMPLNGTLPIAELHRLYDARDAERRRLQSDRT